MKIPEKYVPLFAYRSEIYQNIVAQIRNWLPGMLLNCDDVCIDNAFDRVFDDYQINAYLWEELVRNLDVSLDQAENYDFNANVGDFIPAFDAERCQECWYYACFHSHEIPFTGSR